MNPSPNRSSKTRKSSSSNVQPGDEAVLPIDSPVTSQTPDEPSLSVASGEPVAPDLPTPPPESPLPVPQRPRYTPVASEKSVKPDNTASTSAPQRPRHTPAVVSSPSVSSQSDFSVVPNEPATTPEGPEPPAPTEESSAQTGSAARLHPIPPPSEPRQYRAVGLVRGRYAPSADQFTRGMLVATDGTQIDAVLLGRVMSLVKNHLNLEQEHLWVVYPRTRQQDGNLHTQIMGVWEPETLNRKEEPAESENDPAAEVEGSGEVASTDLAPETQMEDGYFSIRGEVIYQSQDETKYLIVKIKQSPRKEADKIKFFKLKLIGAIAEKAVGRFWDFHVKLQADNLLIEAANDIGQLPMKKRMKPGGFKKRPFPPRKGGGRPQRSDYPPSAKPPAAAGAVRREAVPKPVKRSKPSEE